MATTTNYGWTTPDDTALVKDGASAIRSLGTAIDTTTKNLNPSTTLGDIEYRSSTSNTNTRLGIGTSGQVLTVSGGVPAWTTLSTGAGNLAQIATGTCSGTSVTLSSLSTYSELILAITNLTWDTSNAQLRVRINDNSTTNYATYGYRNLGSSNQSSTDAAADAAWGAYGASVDRTNGTSMYIWKFTNCKNAGFTDVDIFSIFYAPSASEFQTESKKVVYKVSEAVSSLKFALSGGQNMSAGTYVLWGA